VGKNEDDDDLLGGMYFSKILAGEFIEDGDEDGPDMVDDDDDPHTLDAETISGAARHSGNTSIYTPNELLPPELDGMDLGAYDIVEVSQRGGVEKFLGLYLPNTRIGFAQTGVAVYECILRFPFRRPVNDEDVKAYMQRCRSMLSRLRAEKPEAPFFYMALVQYEILRDRKHVAIGVARMAPPNYSVWASEQKKTRDKMRSTISQLKDML
jgi:hypothetical protein